MQAQTRNWIIFFVLFFAVMLGHAWLRNKFWPPPEPVSPEALAAADRSSRIVSAITGYPYRDAVTAAIQASILPQNAETYAAAEREAKAKAVAAAKPVPPPKPLPPPQPQEKPQFVELGGDDFLLRVTLTTLGAGVRHLVLTPFPEANGMGLPVKKPNGQPEELDLIPVSETPSFAIYHYPNPDTPNEERPLDTLGTRVWKLAHQAKQGDEQSASFVTEMPELGLRLTKTYTLRKREFHLGLSVRIERLKGATSTAPFRYQLAGAHDLPIEGIWYTSVFRNALVAWVNSKGSVERVLDSNVALDHSGGSERYLRADRQIQYAAVAVQYFASAIVADDRQPNPRIIDFVRATVESQPDPKKSFLDDITVRAAAEKVDPKPGETVEHKYLLYHGPIKVRLLNQLKDSNGKLLVDPQLIQRYESTLHLNSLTDYGKFGFWTETIIFFTNLVHWLIGILRTVIPFDAICIMLVTVIVRGVMFPLSRKQAATMARTQEQMAKIQPEMKKIKEKFKGDMLAQQQAMTELYRRHGVNPAAGLGGCLMVFLQMPIFLGLYFALQESFFFRLERFLWAPNLTAPDMLFWWSDKIPIISDPDRLGSFGYLGPYFNLLPVIAVTLMFIQQKLLTPPAMDEQTKMQQSMFKYMMIFMGLMFYKVPAGLCLYFICSTAWGIAERKLLPKKKTQAGPGDGGAPARLPTRPAPGPRGRNRPKPSEPGWLRSRWQKLLEEASKK